MLNVSNEIIFGLPLTTTSQLLLFDFHGYHLLTAFSSTLSILN